MAFSKIIFNSTTLMDVTQDTVAADNLLAGETATGADGEQVTGAYVPSGGEPQVVPTIERGVFFIDYTGEVVEEWETSTVAGKTALPSNPSHTGLTAKGWNWTLANIKTYMGNHPDALLTVGQEYTTTSGATEIDFTLADDLTPYLVIAPNGTATVDWGDGSTASTVTGTSTGTNIYTGHTYAAAGSYTIKITATSGTFAFVSANGENGNILAAYSYASKNWLYSNRITEIRCGTGCTIGARGFAGCGNLLHLILPRTDTAIQGTILNNAFNLRSLTIPNGVTSVGSYAFNNAYSMRTLSLPNGITSFATYSNRFSLMLAALALPDSVTTLNTYVFDNTANLSNPAISTSLTTIPSYSFSNNVLMQRLTIPSNITTIQGNAFYGNRCLAEWRFEGTTPPTISATSAYTNVNTFCVIYVPVAGLAAYLSKSNYPSKSSYTYIGFGTYENGTTLPTQDSTQAYNLTWYATKADALAQTNAITTGNGSEVYCRYVAV